MLHLGVHDITTMGPLAVTALLLQQGPLAAQVCVVCCECVCVREREFVCVCERERK